MLETGVNSNAFNFIKVCRIAPFSARMYVHVCRLISSWFQLFEQNTEQMAWVLILIGIVSMFAPKDVVQYCFAVELRAKMCARAAIRAYFRNEAAPNKTHWPE